MVHVHYKGVYKTLYVYIRGRRDRLVGDSVHARTPTFGIISICPLPRSIIAAPMTTRNFNTEISLFSARRPRVYLCASIIPRQTRFRTYKSPPLFGGSFPLLRVHTKPLAIYYTRIKISSSHSYRVSCKNRQPNRHERPGRIRSNAALPSVKLFKKTK